jgi:hypothetical protein
MPHNTFGQRRLSFVCFMVKDQAIINYFYLHVYNNVEEDMINKCEGDIRR